MSASSAACDYAPVTIAIESYYVDRRFSLRPPAANWQETREDAGLQRSFGVATVDIEVPSIVESTLQAIHSARPILELGDNWDGEGSPGYTITTWERATSFLVTQARIARDRASLEFFPPMISPAGDGSIDLYWQRGTGSLLINIPSDVGEAATFYGQTASGDTIAGQLNTNTPRPDLVLWVELMR